MAKTNSKKDPNSTPPTPPRYYWFKLLLYPDCPAHDRFLHEYLPKITSQWFGILHDRDIAEEDNHERGWVKGQLKKAHWHIVMRCPFQKTESAFGTFIEPLGVASYYARGCDCWSASVYLDHRFCPDKFQYDLSDIFGDRSLYLKSTAQGGDAQFEDFIAVLNDIKVNGLNYVEAICLLHDKGLLDFVKSHMIYNNMVLMSVRNNEIRLKN